MDFLEQLKLRVMVTFGGLGTECEKRGFRLTDNYAVWTLEHPDIYKDVLKSYADAGTDIFPGGDSAANRFRLKHIGRTDQAFRITRDVTKLGREFCLPGCYLCGLLNGLGQLLQPFGEISFEEAYESYKEQVLAMTQVGIDLVWILTMTEIATTEAAIRAAKDNTNLPVIASMAFDPTPKGYRTIMGVSPKEAAEKLDKVGADVIGANCGGVNSAQVTDILKEMAQVTSKPLVAKPNAGRPEVIGDRTTHPASPEEMAAQVPMWIAAGARVVGGCCGAGPEHIAKIAKVVRQVSK